MYAGVTEGKIYKIDPLRLNEPIVSNSSHSGSVFSLLGFEDFIYSSGKDGKIIAWNKKLEKIDEIQAHNSTINSICMLGDSDIIASACRDGSIRLWQAATLELLKVIDLYLHSGHLRSVNKLLWNDHAKLLISCSDDKKIKTWQID
jgi:WD40 repeat protein